MARRRTRNAGFHFELHGAKELERALMELPKAISKSVLRSALRKAARPVVNAAKANARSQLQRRSGRYLKSLRAGTTLSSRQRQGRVKVGDVEMFIGSTSRLGHLFEFGWKHSAARPHLRPAWDAHKQQVAETIGSELWNEIAKAAARLARRAQAGTLSRSHRRHLGG